MLAERLSLLVRIILPSGQTDVGDACSARDLLAQIYGGWVSSPNNMNPALFPTGSFQHDFVRSDPIMAS
jgi:hypothetical protein